MNALRPFIQRSSIAVAATRRCATTVTGPQQGVHNLSAKSAVPPQMRSRGFKQDWLSDPSTYPIMLIMGTAITFMTGMGIHALTSYKDLRIDPRKKHAEMQFWGHEKQDSVVKAVATKNPWYTPYFTEGAGVNHEEWVKAKAAEKATWKQ